MRRVIGAVACVVLALGVLILSQADTANIWVDGNGGTCTYSASLATYVDAAACATLDAAVDAATTANGTNCGDVIVVKAGTYAGQTITNYRSCGGGGWERVTTVRPENYDCDAEGWPTAESAVVLTGGLDMDGENSTGAGYLKFCGLTFAVANVENINAEGTANDNSRYSYFVRGSRYIWIQRNVMGGFGFFLNGFNLGNTGSGNLRVTNNLIEECHEANPECTNGKLDIIENALIEGNLFRNFRSLANCHYAPSPVDCGHWEFLFLNGTADVTIRRNRGYNYQHSAAFYVTCSGPDIATVGNCHRNLTIENNITESPHNNSPGEQDWGQPSERGEAAIGLGHCEGHGGTDYTNVIVRHNTVFGAAGAVMFDGSTGSGCNVGAGAFGVGGVWYIGNLANQVYNSNGCSHTNVTFDYNVGTIYPTLGNNPCGSSEVNGTDRESIIVDGTWGNASQDAALVSGSTVAQALVPEEYCPPDDFWGNARPAGDCAAGALEFGSEPPSGGGGGSETPGRAPTSRSRLRVQLDDVLPWGRRPFAFM